MLPEAEELGLGPAGLPQGPGHRPLSRQGTFLHGPGTG